MNIPRLVPSVAGGRSRVRGRTTARLAVAALVAGVAVLPAPAAQAAGSVVKVEGTQGAWRLTVDGRRTRSKG